MHEDFGKKGGGKQGGGECATVGTGEAGGSGPTEIGSGSRQKLGQESRNLILECHRVAGLSIAWLDSRVLTVREEAWIFSLPVHQL